MNILSCHDPVLSPYSELKMLDHDNRHGLLIKKNKKKMQKNNVRVMFRGQKKTLRTQLLFNIHKCNLL